MVAAQRALPYISPTSNNKVLTASQISDISPHDFFVGLTPYLMQFIRACLSRISEKCLRNAGIVIVFSIYFYIYCAFLTRESTEPELISLPLMLKCVILRKVTLKVCVREGTSGSVAHENKQIQLFGLIYKHKLYIAQIRTVSPFIKLWIVIGKIRTKTSHVAWLWMEFASWYFRKCIKQKLSHMMLPRYLPSL